MGEKFKKCIKFGGGGEKQEGEGKRLTVIYLKGLDENAQVSFLNDFMPKLLFVVCCATSAVLEGMPTSVGALLISCDNGEDHDIPCQCIQNMAKLLCIA